MNFPDKDLDKMLLFADFTIEHAAEEIFWVDSNAHIQRVNEAACRKLGYSREEFAFMNVQDINPDSDAETWREHWEELRKNKSLLFEARSRAKDGRTYPVEILANFIEFDGKEYCCCFARDITERKKAQEQLRKVTEENTRFENELKFATQVQEGFLPCELPRHRRFEFAARTVPARFVGGDFYDFIPLGDHRLGILLGDVSGKGVSAALCMARLMSDFRFASPTDSDPGHVMARVNRVLGSRCGQGLFATAVFLVLDLERNRIRVANAGHYPLLIRDAAGRVRERGGAQAPPLGVLPDSQYPPEEIQLHEGDLVFLYTDGAVEPMNPQGHQLGLKGLSHILSDPGLHPEDLLGRVRETLGQFSENAPPRDDLTLLAFLYK